MWGNVALLILQLALGLVTWLKQNQAIGAGRDQEIARAALAILDKTAFGKTIVAKLGAMSDPEVDSVLKELEG
jgi:hypothetical protein